jgi:hypothetical protein
VSLIIANQRAIVQRLCGYPDQQEISSSNIDAIFHNEALDWLNNRRPAVGLTYFTTVADQQDYAVKPANALRIVDVWWQSQGADVFSPDLSYIPSSMEMTNAFAGFNIFDNPAIATEFYKKMSEYDHTFAASGFETLEGKIRLEPVPGSSGDKVYFEYSYPRWTHITQTPAEYVEAVRLYVASCVMQVLAIRRGIVTGGKDYSGGGGVNEIKYQEKFLADAEALVPYLDQTIYRG